MEQLMYAILKVMVQVPYSNEFIEKGTKLEVVEQRGRYSVCSYNGGNICIDTNNLEVVNDEQ